MIDTKQRAKYIFEEYANCYSEVDIEKLAKHLDEIKAEAINEFEERLKAKYRCYDLITPLAAIIEVDNTKKEMVGDV